MYLLPRKVDNLINVPRFANTVIAKHSSSIKFLKTLIRKLLQSAVIYGLVQHYYNIGPRGWPYDKLNLSAAGTVDLYVHAIHG